MLNFFYIIFIIIGCKKKYFSKIGAIEMFESLIIYISEMFITNHILKKFIDLMHIKVFFIILMRATKLNRLLFLMKAFIK